MKGSNHGLISSTICHLLQDQTKARNFSQDCFSPGLKTRSSKLKQDFQIHEPMHENLLGYV